MKRLLLTALLGLGLATYATPASADSIAAGDWIRMTGSSGTLGGGAFSLDNLSTATVPDFLTFCLQRSQHIDYSNAFLVGSITDHTDDLPVNDPISDETAWIYSSFRRGLLTGLYGSDAIQAAIWIFENEWTTDVNNSGLLRLAAINAVLAGYHNDGVQVLNLFYANGAPAQDQLTYTETPPPGSDNPVPEPASMVLLGTGLLVAAAGVRRHRRRQS